MTRGGRASWILAIIAHVLAWVAYLPLAVGLVLWPYLQGESGEEYGVLIAVFVPVALTGLALLTVLGVRRSGGFPLLAFGARVAPLLLFIIAGLAIYTVSQFYLPWEAKVVIGLAIGGIALGPVFIGGRIVRVLCRFITVGLLCTDGFFGWRLFPAIRPAIAVAGDGLQFQPDSRAGRGIMLLASSQAGPHPTGAPGPSGPAHQIIEARHAAC